MSERHFRNVQGSFTATYVETPQALRDLRSNPRLVETTREDVAQCEASWTLLPLRDVIGAPACGETLHFVYLPPDVAKVFVERGWRFKKAAQS